MRIDYSRSNGFSYGGDIIFLPFTSLGGRGPFIFVDGWAWLGKIKGVRL